MTDNGYDLRPETDRFALCLGATTTTRVADGLRADDPAGAAVLREAEELGLRPEVGDREAWEGDGRLVSVRAEVPGDTVTPAHLRAMVGLVLQVVRELAGDSPEPRVLRGRAYTLGRRPEPGPAPTAPRSEAVTLRSSRR